MAGLITSVALATASFSTVVHSMNIGHSRLLSPVGQPLRIQTPLLGVSAQDSLSLSVSIAPASAWQQAGLVPPVDLSSLQVAVFDGARPGSRLVTISSAQPLTSGVADLLLVVRSSAGQVQHQVSVLAPADLQVVAAATAQANRVPGPAVAGSHPSGAGSGQAIQVRQGYTLFSLARRYAVPGVSLHQWMVAVQTANPSAFLQDNVNLLKAGATLVVPDHSALVALSDAQARRVYQQHGQAFAAYRQRLAARKGAPLGARDAARGGVSAPDQAPAAPAETGSTDKVVLSSGSSASSSADDAVALQKNTQEAKSRVVTLEDNVKNLNEALQQQGAVASEVAAEGAKALAGAADAVADAAGKAVSAVDKAADAVGQAIAGNEQSVEAEPAPTVAGAATAAGQSAGTTTASSSGASVASSPVASGSATPASVTSSGAADSNVSPGAAALSLPASSALSLRLPEEPASPSLGLASSVPLQPSKSFSFVSWFQDNLWAVLAGVLALVVVVFVWLLRRGSAGPMANSGVTEDMVRERLQGINLDLDEPPQGGSTTPR